MNSTKRSAEEYIILALSGATALSLFPFALFRILNADWAIATLDSLAVLVAAGLFVYVLRYRETKASGWIMVGLCLTALVMTIALKGVAQLMWVYPALTAIFFLLTPRLAVAISAVTLLVIGALLWQQLTFFTATQFYISAGVTLAFSFAFADRMREQHKQLEHLAVRDPLTNAFNRRAMEQRLLDIMAFQRRNQRISASLILMDLDKFKHINDTYGHATGDDILVRFAEVVFQRIRATDQLYRFGGEEFVVIAEDTVPKDAANLAEQLRHAIETDEKLARHGVTISVGTADYRQEETAFEWLGRADRAMYRAKHLGRNACCAA